MSSQDRDDVGVSFAPPPEVDDWLAAEAAGRTESRDEICRRLVAAAHAVVTDDDHEPVHSDDLAAVQRRLETQREELTAHLEDVRSRVVQVKRETDAKAPADHEHPDSPTDEDLDALRIDLAALEETVDDGFDNFETVLADLLAETDELADRSTLLARAVVDLREQRDELADRQRRRAAADELKLAANRLGIRTATCADCDSSVDIALLTAPECPHCASGVTDVAERSSIFGSHRLLTGEPPALEGRVAASTRPPTDELREAVADAESTPGETDSPSSDGRPDTGGRDR